jgi:subfamily B ATP-binding cassette protein MsbA
MKKVLSILKYLIPYWHIAFLSVLFHLFVAVFSVVSFAMVIPFLGLLFSSQQFVDYSIDFNFSIESISHNFNYYLGQIFIEKGQLQALLFIIITVLVFSLLKNIFLYLGKSLVIIIRTNVVKDVRNELMNKILDFDLSYFSNERKGDIISKMVLDVKEIELSIISSLEMLFKDPILLIVYTSVLLVLSAKLTLIVLLIFPISALIIWQIGRKLKRGSLRGQQKMGLLVGMLEESLSGIKIVKAFNAEKFIEKRFQKINQHYSNLFSRVWRQRTLANPVSEIISTISILIIMWFGGKMVFNPDANLSSQVFIGYLAVFTQVIGPAKSFSGGYYNILKGIASVERIDSILSHKFDIVDKENAQFISEFKQNIEYKNVSFKYDNDSKSVLHNINFEIEKGQTIAIVGYSGSGKSTIVDLLPRFFDPVSGEILIDGVSLKDYKIRSLRSLFGYVNQEPVLFNDSIYNNILFGNQNATKEQIEKAARLSFAHDFIMQKEQAYETNLGESGDKLSLGEKQRISIARALLNNPPILILDEATSALDYNSELIVRKALGNLMKDRTTIVIAHRLSTIKSADKILVVDQGKVVEQGTHDELIEQKEYYYKLNQLEFL